MYTSNGNYSLRNSFPEDDSGIVKKLRASGVVILGKLGLSEYANSFGNQPSGFSQPHRPGRPRPRRRPEPERLVVGLRHGGRRGAVDADRRHRDRRARSSARRARRASSASGPTVGLVPGVRHRPDLGVAGHRRPDGPHASPTRRCTCSRSPAAIRSRTRRLRGRLRRRTRRRRSRRRRTPLPDYMSALDLNFVRGKRIGYNGTFADGTPAKLAFDALVAAGAIMVPRAADRRRDRARRCRAATSSTRRSTSTTSASARARRSSRWPRRSPTTRPTRTRR